jgi:ribonuclease HI
VTTPARFVVFADGSSLTNPGGPGGTGFIVYDRDTRALRFGGNRYLRDGDQAVTNNRMELRAVLEALEPLPRGATVDVHSDSQYLINSLSKWVHGWRKKGWMTSQGTPVLNRDLMESILAHAAQLTVRYQWVRGHAGHAANEAADALAQTAARGGPQPLTTAQVLAALQKVGVATGLSTARG